jgi:hypothetical protein
MRRCGRRYPDAATARRSKNWADGSTVRNCACGGVHIVKPPKPRKAKARAEAQPGRPAGTLRRRGRNDPSQATRQMVYERDGNMCVCCGRPVEGRPHSVGHRKRRSQGGTNDLSNLLTFLGLGVNPSDPDDHHARIDAGLDPHDEGRGYSLESWQDPAAEPVMIFSESGSGAMKYLTDDGALADELPEPGVRAA